MLLIKKNFAAIVDPDFCPYASFDADFEKDMLRHKTKVCMNKLYRERNDVCFEKKNTCSYFLIFLVLKKRVVTSLSSVCP